MFMTALVQIIFFFRWCILKFSLKALSQHISQVEVNEKKNNDIHVCVLKNLDQMFLQMTSIPYPTALRLLLKILLSFYLQESRGRIHYSSCHFHFHYHSRIAFKSWQLFQILVQNIWQTHTNVPHFIERRGTGSDHSQSKKTPITCGRFSPVSGERYMKILV